MLEYIGGNIIYSLIGRICLYTWFRNADKVKRVLLEKYNNSFSMAGATLVWLAVAWVLLVAISVGLISILLGIGYALISRSF